MFLIISDRNMLLSASVDMKIKGSDLLNNFAQHQAPLWALLSALLPFILWLFQAQFKNTMQSGFAN